MAYKLGLDARLFFGTAGSTASSEMTNVKDVTLNLESGEADITTRAAEGWRISAATLKEASLEFEMVWDTQDAGFKAIKNAFFNNSAVALFASDGDGNGLDADFVVSSFSRSEPLEEALTVSVTCKPTLIDRAPTWKDGSGS
jgi:predicted secreted protein